MCCRLWVGVAPDTNCVGTTWAFLVPCRQGTQVLQRRDALQRPLHRSAGHNGTHHCFFLVFWFFFFWLVLRPRGCMRDVCWSLRSRGSIHCYCSQIHWHEVADLHMPSGAWRLLCDSLVPYYSRISFIIVLPLDQPLDVHLVSFKNSRVANGETS